MHESTTEGGHHMHVHMHVATYTAGMLVAMQHTRTCNSEALVNRMLHLDLHNGVMRVRSR